MFGGVFNVRLRRAYIIVFGQFFDLEGGSLKGRKIFGAKKTLDLRFVAFLCFRLPPFIKNIFDNSESKFSRAYFFVHRQPLFTIQTHV